MKNKFKDADICSKTTKKSKGVIKQIQHFALLIRERNKQDEICIETTMAKVDTVFVFFIKEVSTWELVLFLIFIYV